MSKLGYEQRARKGNVSDGWALSETLDTQGKKRPCIQALFTRPSMYTVQFGLSGVKGGAPVYRINPVALVSWKLEGIIVTRKLSISDGCSISGVAEGCEVKVWDDSDLTIGLEQSYVLNCTIGPGVRPSNAMPPMYRPIVPPTPPAVYSVIGKAFVPSLGTVNVPIPTSIGAVSAYARAFYSGTPVVPARGEVEASLRHSASLMAGWDAFYDGALPQPIGSSSDTLQLTNYTSVAMVYAIAFGVDG